jgi:hypothetical protein
MNIRLNLAPTMLALVPSVLLAACQADYAADLTNRTPQPVVAQIFRKGGNKAVLGTYRRLGPGDRSYVGPVRTDKDHGAFLSIDTLGNPGRPLAMDLPPGTSFFEIRQDGPSPDSPLRLVEKH